MKHILLAVDDSPAGLAATRTAIALTAQCAGRLRAIHVLRNGNLERILGGANPDDVRIRREHGAEALLRHVADLAQRAGVPAETHTLAGQPARCILKVARDWPADLIVLGRAGSRHLGQPYVGAEVHHVLEFADIPVLVVPPPP